MRRWAELPLRAAVVVYACLVVVPLRYFATQTGLDASWAFALNALAGRGLAYGRDLAYTYGPWGYLALPVGGGETLWQGVAVQIALWAAFAALMGYLAFVRRVPLLNLAVFAALAQGGAGCFHNFGYAGFDLFVVFVVLVLLGCALEPVRWRWFFGAAVVLGCGLLLVKTSSGVAALSAVGMFAAGLVLVERQRGWEALAMAGAAPVVFALLFFCHAASVGALWGFVRSSVEVSSGFSLVMSEGETGKDVWAAMWIALAIGVNAGLLWWQGQRAAVLALACMGPLFIEFRHSMVRTAGHVEFFFQMAALAVGVVALFTVVRRVAWWPAALGLGLFVAAWLPREEYVYWRPVLEPARALRVLTDFAGTRRALEAQSAAALAGNALPGDLRAALAGHTFGVFPLEITWAAPMVKRFRPFPVWQAFQAYTPYLDRMNAEFLADAGRAPEYLVFDWEAIDGRHPLLDVPAVTREMYRHYEAAGRYGSHLLLRRRQQPRFGEARRVGGTMWQTDKPLMVPAARHPLEVRIHLRLSAGGWLRNLAYRVEPMGVVLTGEEGAIISARVPPGVLVNGVMVNSLPASLDEFEEWMKGGRVLTMNAVDLFGPGVASFAGMAEVEFFELPDLTLAERPAAVAVERVTSASLHVELINGKGTGGYGPEEVIGLPSGEPVVTLSGYGFEWEAGAGRELFVEVDGRPYRAKYGLPSGGLAAAAGKAQYRLCGFQWTAPVWRLGAGRHELRLRMRSRDGSRDLVSAEQLRVEVAPATTK